MYGWIDVVRPVVEVDDALFLRRGRHRPEDDRGDHGGRRARLPREDRSLLSRSRKRGRKDSLRDRQQRVPRCHQGEDSGHVSVGSPAAFQARRPPAIWAS